MAESHLTLPLLPLRSGVLLPGMAFTIALESPEAAAAAAAAGVGGRVLVVPHIEGRYASIGVVAELVEHGELLGHGEHAAEGVAAHKAVDVVGEGDGRDEAVRRGRDAVLYLEQQRRL